MRKRSDRFLLLWNFIIYRGEMHGVSPLYDSFSFSFVFILPALLSCYCRSVSSFSNAKAGIPDSLCAARTAMSQCIEKVQKSAENEYSSGNRYFSRPSREFPSNLFRISEFVTHWCSMYVRNVIRDWSIFVSVI